MRNKYIFIICLFFLSSCATGGIENVEKANAHYLARLGTGDLFHIFLSKPIRKIDDFKGMKIRVSPTHIPFLKSLGAEPVVTPPAEIYTAMERAVVVGYVQPLASIRTMGLLPVTKYLLRPGFYQPIVLVLVNLDFWKKMPDHLKHLLTENMKKAEYIAMENIDKKIKVELDEFKKAGVEKAKVLVITLPKEIDSGEIVRISKALNPQIEIIIRKHHSGDEIDESEIFAVIEPEFEATMKMLEKLLHLMRHRDKSVLNWVRRQKKALQ